MPAVDVLIPPGETCLAVAELTQMNPRRDQGEGKSPATVDTRFRFKLSVEDVPTLAKLFPFAEQLMEPGVSWTGKATTTVGRTLALRVADLQGVEVIAGDSALRKAMLDIDGISRWLELTLRVSVGEDYEVPVQALRTVVHVEVSGRKQEAKKAKAGKGKGGGSGEPGQEKLFCFGAPMRAIPTAERGPAIVPQVDDVVEIRTGGKTTTWAQVVEVLHQGDEAQVLLRDLGDARTRETLPVLRIARAVQVQADPKLLNRYKSKAKKAGHGKPASWRWLMEAWQRSGKPAGSARLVDDDVVDRALEAMEQDAVALEHDLELTHGLPPEDADAASAARGGPVDSSLIRRRM